MYCVIGNPIKHSQSKYIQNIFIKEFNSISCYFKYKITIKNFYKKIMEIIINKYNFNITIPYKENILKIFNLYEKYNISFNVSLFKHNSLIGLNTDRYYFNKKFNKTDKKFIILGLGGVAKSIIVNFIKKNIFFYINYSNKKKIKKISKIVKKKIKYSNIKTNNIIIDCTPCVLYNKTPLKKNKKIKIVSVNYKNTKIYYNNFKCILTGEELLIIQAFQSFKIWNNLYNYKFNRIKKFILKNFNDKN